MRKASDIVLDECLHDLRSTGPQSARLRPAARPGRKFDTATTLRSVPRRAFASIQPYRLHDEAVHRPRSSADAVHRDA